MLHRSSCLWGKLQLVLGVDAVCHGSGRTYCISDHSVAIPVPRVVPSGRAALVPNGTVGWPSTPPGSSLDTGCSVLTHVAVLKVCLCSHHSLHELVLSLGEARELFITSVPPKGRVNKSIWTKFVIRECCFVMQAVVTTVFWVMSVTSTAHRAWCGQPVWENLCAFISASSLGLEEGKNISAGFTFRDNLV